MMTQSNFDLAKEYFINVFITPYNLDKASKNMMINSFIFGYKFREEIDLKLSGGVKAYPPSFQQSD